MTQHNIDIDSPEFEDAPKALRDAYKALRKEHEGIVKERDTYRNQVVSHQVGSVLADKGFKNPKRVERDLLADGIDPLDNSAVESWLSENGDDYARGASPASQQDPVQQQAAATQGAIQAVVSDSTAAEAQTRFERAQAEIGAIDRPTGDQVNAIYLKYGV